MVTLVAPFMPAPLFGHNLLAAMPRRNDFSRRIRGSARLSGK
jgi:hypothetical protein